MFKAPIQEKYFTIDAEIAFDLNEFLDFNKVPGLDEPAEDLAALQQEPSSAAEPDLTWNKLASPILATYPSSPRIFNESIYSSTINIFSSQNSSNFCNCYTVYPVPVIFQSHIWYYSHVHRQIKKNLYLRQ